MTLVWKIRDHSFNASDTNIGVNAIRRSDDGYVDLSSNAVEEIYRMEIFRPEDAGDVQKIKYATLEIGGEDYPIHPNESMLPPIHEGAEWPGFDLGTPLLATPYRGGRRPDAVESAVPKVAAGDKWIPKVMAEETIDQDFTIRTYSMLCEGEKSLVDAIGTRSLTQTVTLRSETGTTKKYSKTIPVQLGTFDVLNGGIDADRPRVFPYLTYTTNNNATTANQAYEFKTLNSNVDREWKSLYYDFDRTDAVAIERMGVAPHANSKATRIYVAGRTLNPWYTTDETRNLFPYGLDRDTTGGTSQIPPRKFKKAPIIAWDRELAIQHKDTGTSIPADAVNIAVYGKAFDLTKRARV